MYSESSRCPILQNLRRSLYRLLVGNGRQARSQVYLAPVSGSHTAGRNLQLGESERQPVCALSVSETAATATGRPTIVRRTCRNLQLSELRFLARLRSQLWAPPAVSAFLRHQALLGGRDIRARVAPGHHDHHHLHFYIFRQCRISPTTQFHMVSFPSATGEKPEIPTLNQQSLAQCSYRPI